MEQFQNNLPPQTVGKTEYSITCIIISPNVFMNLEKSELKEYDWKSILDARDLQALRGHGSASDLDMMGSGTALQIIVR